MNKKHETYCDYDLISLLTKSGFNWIKYSVVNSLYDKDFHWEIPLHIAQKWLREVKKCYVSIVADCDSIGVFYHTRIIYYDTDNNYHATYVWEETELERVKHRAIFDNYEEALEAGIKKALEIILEKGE